MMPRSTVAALLAFAALSSGCSDQPAVEANANQLSDVAQEPIVRELDPRTERASLRFNACISNTMAPFTQGEITRYGGVRLELGNTAHRNEYAYIALSRQEPKINDLQVFIGNIDTLAATSEDKIVVPYLRKTQTLTYGHGRDGPQLVKSEIGHENTTVYSVSDTNSTQYHYDAPLTAPAQPLTPQYGNVGYAAAGSSREAEVTNCVKYAFGTSSQFQQTELASLDRNFPAESKMMVAERHRVFGR